MLETKSKMMSIAPSFPSSKNLNQAMMSVSKSMKNLGDSVHSGYNSLPTPALPTMPINVTMPEINVSVPRKVSVSGVGARLLGRGSGGSKADKRLERHSRVTNIFCSDMVGRDSIIEDFEQVIEDNDVTKAEIEDLLLAANYDEFTSHVGKLVFANDRSWEMIQFLDSFDMQVFKVWHKQKETMMRDYERCWAHLPGSTDTKQVLTFKAVITIQEGTSITDFLKVLKKIKNDSDIFAMSLYGVAGAQVAHEELASRNRTGLVDWDKQVPTLKHQLSMELECGWKEPDSAAMLFLSSCLYQLKLQVNLAHEEEMAVACSAKQFQQQEANAGGGSLAAMRRSLTERAQQKNLDDSDRSNGSSAARLSKTGRRPRSSPSLNGLQRSMSDCGDRPLGKERRRRKSGGNLPGLQRTQSDSGDVIDPTTGSRGFAKRAGRRRDSRNNLMQRQSSLKLKRQGTPPTSNTTTSGLKRNNSSSLRRQGTPPTRGVGRSVSDSGDVMPRRPMRKSVSPSSGHGSGEQQQQRTTRASALYQMRTVASAMTMEDSSDGACASRESFGSTASFDSTDSFDACPPPPPSFRRSVTADAATPRRGVRRAASDCGDERRVPTRRSNGSSKQSLRRTLQDASASGDDMNHMGVSNSDHTPPTTEDPSLLYTRAASGNRRAPPRRAASDIGDDRYNHLLEGASRNTRRATAGKRSLSKPRKSAFEALVDSPHPMGAGAGAAKSLARSVSDMGDDRKPPRPTRRTLIKPLDTDEDDGTSPLKRSASRGRKSEPTLSESRGRKSEPTFRRVLSDNPEQYNAAAAAKSKTRSTTTKRSPRRKSDPSSAMKKAAEDYDDQVGGSFDMDEFSDSDDEQQEVAACGSSPMRNARWQSRSPTRGSRSTSPFAQTTAASAMLAASYHSPTRNSHPSTNSDMKKKVENLLYASDSGDESEYSVDMEDELQDDDVYVGEEDDLEVMQLKELQLLANSGSAMTITDLLTMRRTLDAAIASLGEANQLVDNRKPAANHHHDSASIVSQEGPDYDWERGVFCRQQTTPRAA